MKKMLCCTTALVGAISAAQPVGAAEPLKLGLSGNMQQWFGVVSQDDAREGTAAERKFNNVGFSTNTLVGFSAETALDNGIVVHAEIKLDTWNGPGTGADAGAPQQGRVTVREQWASLAGGWGMLRMGIKEAGNVTLHHEATDAGIGYGKVDQWLISPASANANGTFPNQLNAWDGTSFDAPFAPAPSIAYFTPKFSGFQLGLSYLPSADTVNTAGAGSGVGVVNRTNQRNNFWDATLAYENVFGGLKVGADIGLAKAYGAKNGANQDQRLYEAGLTLGYGDFTLGGATMHLEENNAIGIIQMEGYSWNAGLQYAPEGPWALSALYYAERHKATVTPGSDTFQTYLVSGKYNLGPGIDAKTSAFWGEYDGEPAGATNSRNDGYGLVSGIDLTF